MRQLRSQRGFSAMEITIFIALLLLLLVAGYLAYRASVAKPKTPNQMQQSQSTAPAKSTVAGFAVPELGIRLLNLPAGLKDLVYVPLSNHKAAEFSTTALTELDAQCGARGNGIGSLLIVPDQYDPESPPDDLSLVKQFPDFWLGYTDPAAACSSDSQTEKLHQDQTAAFKATLGNPANVELISNAK